jgi:hypothetical protein
VSEETSTFHVRIDGCPEQQITVKTGQYMAAVAAIPALLGADPPMNVEIWVPRLLPDYGPYFYRLAYDEYVCLRVTHLHGYGRAE